MLSREINRVFQKSKGQEIWFKGSIVTYITIVKKQSFFRSFRHTRFNKRMINKLFVRHLRHMEINQNFYTVKYTVNASICDVIRT